MVGSVRYGCEQELERAVAAEVVHDAAERDPRLAAGMAADLRQAVVPWRAGHGRRRWGTRLPPLAAASGCRLWLPPDCREPSGTGRLLVGFDRACHRVGRVAGDQGRAAFARKRTPRTPSPGRLRGGSRSRT